MLPDIYFIYNYSLIVIILLKYNFSNMVIEGENMLCIFIEKIYYQTITGKENYVFLSKTSACLKYSDGVIFVMCLKFLNAVARERKPTL